MKVKRYTRRSLPTYSVIAVVLSLLAMGLPAVSNAAPAHAAPGPNATVCAPNTSFGVLENGQLRKINTGENPGSENYGDVDLRKAYPLTSDYLGYDARFVRKDQVNGLGLAPDGDAFYTFRGWAKGYYDQNGYWNDGVRNNFELYKYDANGQNPQRIKLTEDGNNYYDFYSLETSAQNMDLIAGAVNPADGRYYFGGFHQAQNSAGGYNLYFNLRSIDPTDGRFRHIAQIPVESQNGPYSLNNANGDIVFDASGNFHLLSAKRPSNGSSQVKILTLPAGKLPADNTGSLKQVYASSTATRTIAAADGVANSLAVDSDGTLILATTKSAFKYDPTSFTLERSAQNINGGGQLINTDLASCHFPPTLEVKKDVVDRADGKDQFTLTADDTTDQGIFASATTSGNENGVQAEQIGPAIVRSGKEYVIQEQMAKGSGTKLDDYSTSVECEANYQDQSSEKLELTEKGDQKYGVTIPKTTDRGPANVVCTYTNEPNKPSFKVKKDSGKDGAQAEGGKWTSAYTVTVTNDGEVAGTSKAVTDTPSVPEGFTVTGATVDGEAVEITDGTFTVTDGVKLAAGKDKVFEVVLSGTYEASKADWVAVGECEVEGEGNPAKGLFNKVTMEEDSDGPENNDACNPVSKDPLFKVKKDSAGAELGDGDSFTSKYSVTVTNSGAVAGTSKAVTDTPEFAAGFEPKSVTVDGKSVEFKDGSFVVTDGVELKPGKSKSFEVVIAGSYTDKAEWSKVGRCEADGGLKPGQGLFNAVAMDGDSDGEENNEACNPLEEPTPTPEPEPSETPSKPGDKGSSNAPLPRTGVEIAGALAAAAGLLAAGVLMVARSRRKNN